MTWLNTIISNLFPATHQRVVEPPACIKGAQVTYASEGRCGRVVFTHGEKSFGMYFEFGGGNTVAIIDVPAAAEWVERTAIPLAARQATLEFIGQRVVQDQVSQSRGRYVIHERSITIHA